MIPKIIHLCWFSGDEYPALISKCVKSWEKEMPQYEIKVWTYEMASSIGIKYIDEALSKKKWAFAADVVRLYALYNYGGVYLDSDVFLKKSIEPLLTNDFVSAVEYHSSVIDFSYVDSKGNRLIADLPIPGIGIQAAFLASKPHHTFVEELLSYYTNRNFVLESGELDTAIIAPAHYAINAEKYGFKYVDETQNLGDMTFHKSNLFAGSFEEDNDKALAIHFCNHSWANPVRGRFMTQLKGIMRKVKISICKLFPS